MSQALIQNFEYTAAHIKDFIDEDKLFSTFEIEDITQIMKFANLTTNDFISILKQSQFTVKANKLYMCIRSANVSIQNYEDAIKILKSSKKYLKLTFLDGVIDFLMHSQNVPCDYTEKIQTIQIELSTIQNQKQQSEKELESLKLQLNQIIEENTGLKAEIYDRNRNVNQVNEKLQILNILKILKVFIISLMIFRLMEIRK